ncbi:uncharacterized protein LOC116266690 [Nymphaea colorata]|uniref:uncharacterized protein LOC116266690 n=1 Tax=Nymphaea colorata TaxID=210225 RepID=UPI00129D77F9|nr:uncharacterized protein LOC116266690 [Nymphaea colorata]
MAMICIVKLPMQRAHSIAFGFHVCVTFSVKAHDDGHGMYSDLRDGRKTIIFGIYLPTRLVDRLESLIRLEWVFEFSGNGTIKVSTSFTSDYSFLVYQTFTNSRLNKGHCPFRLFKPWIMDSNGWDIVKKECGFNVTSFPMIRLLKKLGLVKVALLRWNVEKFGRLESRIENLCLCLDQSRLLVENGDWGATKKEYEVRGLLNDALCMEEVLWKQRSQVRWLTEGDKNTYFFYIMTNCRKAKQYIKVIKVDGEIHTEETNILQTCTSHFQQLLRFDVASRDLFAGIIDGNMVTNEENQWMLRPIMREEIAMEVKSLDKDSTAGPDGFSNYFYKDC